MKTFFLLALLVSIIKTNLASYIEIPAVFSDNMVLQQNSEVFFWGKALPDQKVVLTAGWGSNADAKVKNDSTWEVKLKTEKAGGPYEIKIQIGDSIIEYKNVMLGEVWLCSGQSNMEMPLEGWPPQSVIQNSDEEIKNAAYPEIRLFTVSRAVSNKPEFNCTGEWSECSPQTAAKFSAAAYFFGRELYKTLKVPIGLIVSSWGGTKIQSWINGKYLSRINEYVPVMEKINSSGNQIEKLNVWIKNHPVIDVSKKNLDSRWKNLDFNDSVCSLPNFNDNAWRTMKLPTLWEATDAGDFDGVVWFRKKINIPQDWINKELVLKLGAIDDMDRSYVNGVLIGKIEEPGYWQTPRIYKVPKDIVNGSQITIAVRVLDNGGGGGLWGNGFKMEIHPASDSSKTISLEGNWKYLTVAEFSNDKFYLYKVEGEEFYSRPKTSINLGPNTPTMLYNGMIAPLIPYTIAGAIWYQGEANVDIPDEYNNYKTLFPLMIENWRADWKEGDFPFYYVQISPFSYGETSKSQVVREAQLLTLNIPNTGMAVTLDIGDVNNIHPADKQDVGKRLALWALAKNYGKNLVYSGPLYKSMKVEGNKAVLSFDYADGGLILKEKDGKTNFEIAGTDSNYVDAKVKVDGDKLIVSNPKVINPVAVRYAWSNTAEATLFNKEGLPASTFSTVEKK